MADDLSIVAIQNPKPTLNIKKLKMPCSASASVGARSATVDNAETKKLYGDRNACGLNRSNIG